MTGVLIELWINYICFCVQLIYDFKDGGGSIGLISLHPDNLSGVLRDSFERIGVEIPRLLYVRKSNKNPPCMFIDFFLLYSDVQSREYLDKCLSRALNVPLSEKGHLEAIDNSDYVLTLDYAIKMLNIHERYKCGLPVILEGETGVGKTALVEMLWTLWNQSLFSQLKQTKEHIRKHMERQASGLCRVLARNLLPNGACC